MKLIEPPFVHEDERELRRRISAALLARNTRANSYKLGVSVDEQRVGVEQGRSINTRRPLAKDGLA